MITSYDEYKKLALRSIKPHASKEMAILDWTIGLGGEAGEVLDIITSDMMYRPRHEVMMEMAKEIGDIIWYMTALIEELDIAKEIENDKATNDYAEEDTMTNLIKTICRVQEAIKHVVFHKEQDRTEVKKEIVNLKEDVFRLCNSVGIDYWKCATLNAAKLAHRYNLKEGGGYSKAASEARHDAELKFEDTATYKRIYNSINGAHFLIHPDDV